MIGSSTLLQAVLRTVSEKSPLAGAAVDRLDVGDHLLLVSISDGAGARAAGVAHRPPGDLGDDPGGRPALDVGSWAADPPGSGEANALALQRAVGVAALNALSTPLIAWRTGDPFEALSEGVSRIATVGLFGPAFRKFGAVEISVVEQRDVSPPETSPGVSVSVFDPSEAEAAFAGTDVVFVTGSSLLYGGTERYLRAAAGVPAVVLVGATASFVPGPAFEAGATVLAGARVTDAGAVRRGILAGECATDLHDAGLEKVYVAADEGPAGTGLDLR